MSSKGIQIAGPASAAAGQLSEWDQFTNDPLGYAGEKIDDAVEYLRQGMTNIIEGGEEIIVNGYREVSQIGTMEIARSALATIGRSERANADAQRAAGGALVQGYRNIMSTKVGPEFNAVQPPMSFFDMHVERPVIVQRQITIGSITAGAAEVASLVPAARLGRVIGSVPASAPLFRNLAPLDEIVAPRPFAASQVQKVGYSGKLDYVVTQTGELLLGKSGHTSLSGGADVLAAGEARFVKGGVRYLDNVSGHYQPSGASARSAAEEAFNKAGFDATGKYIERSF